MCFHKGNQHLHYYSYHLQHTHLSKHVLTLILTHLVSYSLTHVQLYIEFAYFESLPLHGLIKIHLNRGRGHNDVKHTVFSLEMPHYSLTLNASTDGSSKQGCDTGSKSVATSFSDSNSKSVAVTSFSDSCSLGATSCLLHKVLQPVACV